MNSGRAFAKPKIQVQMVIQFAMKCLNISLIFQYMLFLGFLTKFGLQVQFQNSGFIL